MEFSGMGFEPFEPFPKGKKGRKEAVDSLNVHESSKVVMVVETHDTNEGQ